MKCIECGKPLSKVSIRNNSKRHKPCNQVFMKREKIGHYAIDSKVYFTPQHLAAALNP